jgi:glycosyltransferase A (GT-A) superfamily protein (DUF2064 family)
MDTPQIGAELLTRAAGELVDTVPGPATDSGWWALGLPMPQPARALVDVPMSTACTGALTRKAMRRCGFRVRSLPTHADVDRFEDAVLVAAAAIGGRFAEVVRRLQERTMVLR